MALLKRRFRRSRLEVTELSKKSSAIARQIQGLRSRILAMTNSAVPELSWEIAARAAYSDLLSPATEQVALSHDMETVLEKLSDETREVARLLMHHSPAEIEQQLGMRRGKVRSHISLIREHFESCDLREYLGI